MTLKAVKAKASELGAIVEEDNSGNCNTIRIEAPKGYTWKCCDIHELVDESYKPWKPDYKDIFERMSYGVEPCSQGIHCEWCNPPEE